MISTGLRAARPSMRGLPPRADGFEEVLDLGAVGVAPGGALLGGGLAAGRLILDGGGAALGDGDGVGGGFFAGEGLAVLEHHALEAVAFDDGGAFGAVDVDADGEALVGGRGGGDRADGAAGEIAGGDGDVLDLDVVVGAGAGLAPELV